MHLVGTLFREDREKWICSEQGWSSQEWQPALPAAFMTVGDKCLWERGVIVHRYG